MELVRCRYVNDVDLRILEQLLRRIKGFRVEVLLEAAACLRSGIRPRHQPDAWIAREGRRHDREGAAQADGTDAKNRGQSPISPSFGIIENT
jgi:hypothetical protein